jgi:type II secretory pathway component PulM
LPSTEGLSLVGEWPFGYQEALPSRRYPSSCRRASSPRLGTERARWRAHRERRSLLTDERGLVLAWGWLALQEPLETRAELAAAGLV